MSRFFATLEQRLRGFPPEAAAPVAFVGFMIARGLFFRSVSGVAPFQSFEQPIISRHIKQTNESWHASMPTYPT
jgi:hypothetical protein